MSAKSSNASVVLKVSYGPQIRRVLLNDQPPTIHEVHSQVRALFPDVCEYTLTYVDEEGDVITVMTDEEMAEAMKRTETGPLIRLTITPSSARSPALPPVHPLAPSLAPPPCPPSFLHLPVSVPLPTFSLPPPVSSSRATFAHHAVCDGCGARIFGVRYKCSVCPNFDLCEGCEAAKKFHPLSHAMLKLTRESAFSHFRSPHSVSLRDCHGLASYRTVIPPIPSLSPSFPPPPPPSHGRVHAARCDSCSGQIVGVRYKCLSCEDYDLCRVCAERAHEIHPQNHPFAVIRRPHRSKACLLMSNEIFLPSSHAPSPSPAPSPARTVQAPLLSTEYAPSPVPSPSPARTVQVPLLTTEPAPSPAPVDAILVSPPSKDEVATLDGSDAESDDRRECRSILVALGIADSVITDLMEQFGANAEAILSVVDEERDD